MQKGVEFVGLIGEASVVDEDVFSFPTLPLILGVTRIGGLDDVLVLLMVGGKLETKLPKRDCLSNGWTRNDWCLLIGLLSLIRMTGD